MAEHEKFSEDAIYLTVRTYDNGMSVIMDAATDSLYVKKTLSDYNTAAYEYLKSHEDIQIPAVFSAKEEDGILTVIEEFIHGKKLDEVLDSENKLSFLDRKRILFAVCQGLNFLHSADPKIVHGDLKPSDILIMDDGTVKLTGYNTALTDINTDIAALGALIRKMLPESPEALKIAEMAEAAVSEEAEAKAETTPEEAEAKAEAAAPEETETKAETAAGETADKPSLTVTAIKDALGKLSDPNDRSHVPGFGSRSIGIRILSWAVLAAAAAAAIYGIFRYQRSSEDELKAQETAAVTERAATESQEDASDVQNEASEAIPASSGSMAEASEVSASSSGSAENTSVSSEVSSKSAEETAAASEASSTSAKETSVSETSSESAEETSAASETSSGSAEETSAASEASSGSAEETSATSEASSGSAEEISATSEASSGSAEETSAASEISSGSAEDTSVSETSSGSAEETSTASEASSESAEETSVSETSSESVKETSEVSEISSASTEETSEASETASESETAPESTEETSGTETESVSEPESQEETEAEKAAREFKEQMQAYAAEVSRENDADLVIEKIAMFMDEADAYIEEYGPDGTETAERYRKELIAAGMNAAVRQENSRKVSGNLYHASEALKIYEALENYTDNAETAALGLLDGINADASKAMENGKYDKAGKLYKYLSDHSYDGAEDGLKNVAYQKALQVMAAGNVLDAAEMFDDLSGYKDADEMAVQCRNHYLVAVGPIIDVESGIEVHWVPLDEADGYYVTMDDSVTVDVGPEVTSHTFTEANTNGQEYSFTVTPYFIDADGNKDKGGTAPATTWTYLDKMWVQNLTSNRAGEITITWVPNEYAGYYEVAYGINPELTSTVVIMYMADQPTTQTIDGLVPGEYYYFRVRSSVLGMNNKQYSGEWSQTYPIIVRNYATNLEEY